MPNNTEDFINRLSDEITSDVGNMHDDDLESITAEFSKTLDDALKAFNSSTFDDNGFIKRIRDLDLDDKKDKDLVANVLNTLATDYVNAEALNQSELLLRRDISNICRQMPEMRDVIYVIRDSIIECNVSTGEVSRTFSFKNRTSDQTANEAKVTDIEEKHDLLMAIKNFIVPNTLRNGEMYIHVVPYAKLFAELEAMNAKDPTKHHSFGEAFHESVPADLLSSFNYQGTPLTSDKNIKILTEAADQMTKVDTGDIAKISKSSQSVSTDSVNRDGVKHLLENIRVYNGSSEMMAEFGPDGFRDLILKEYSEYKSGRPTRNGNDPLTHFQEAMSDNYNTISNHDSLKGIEQDDVDIKNYSDIKGCYIRYLDSLRMIPIRMDKRIIGYYYISTTMDLSTASAKQNGIVDLSFQNYTRDRNMVDKLADMIIESFDKKMLERNIKLKNEIVEIIMAHKFSEGRLSFVYIPEDEVVRLVINEDENGKGHSAIEPSLFPARIYMMLTLYNVLYILNNNTTRVHYLKSSGLNKNYAAQIQRTMRKFQARRISIDDIYSYTNVLNKVGGMGEMVLPSGRNDYKALETDTIQAVENPINMEFLEQQRREAISGTGVPHMMMMNSIDEVDFAKTLEMANTRFLSTISAYKIDFNRGLTKLYQRIIKYETDIEPTEVQSFTFKFNASKQQELNITADMISNFDALVDLVGSIYYKKSELEDAEGNPSLIKKNLRKELAKKYMPQLDFDELEQIIDATNIASTDDQLQDTANEVEINQQDIDSFKNNESEQ